MILPEEVPGSEENHLEALDLAQIEHVVTKVEESMIEYLRVAPSLGLEIVSPDLIDIIDAALCEAEGNPAEKVFSQDEKGFFLFGLYEEIIQQPSNIFETVIKADGKRYYVPLKPALWTACLDRLKTKIQEIEGANPGNCMIQELGNSRKPY
ncbi:MAG: hypothetical protein AAGA64_11655 [Bacteroidota bacterium]